MSARFLKFSKRNVGVLGRLVAERNRWIGALCATAALVSIAVAVDATTYVSDRSHLMSLAYSLAYGSLASLAVTLAVYAYLAHLAVRSQISRGHIALDLLGIDAASTSTRVAIVIPTFPFHDAEGHALEEAAQRIDHGRTYVKEQLARFGWPMPTVGLKALPDIGNSAHSRRDVLLLNDLVRLIAASGLQHPIVISDVAFMKELRRAAAASDGVVRLRIGQSDESAPNEAVDTVLLLGLFSNLATCLISELECAPYSLWRGDDERRTIALVDPNTARRSITVPSGSDGPGEVDSSTAYALLARLYYKNLTIGVIGGIDAIGTVRAGDLLTELPPAAREVAEDLRPGADYVAAFGCPGPGSRWGAYGKLGFHQRDGWAGSLVGGSPLPKVLGARAERIATRSGLGRRPT